MIVMKKSLPVSFLILCFFISFSGFGITLTSTGAGGLWGSAASWSPAQVPTSNDSAVVAVGSPININAGGVCQSLTILAGATCTKNSLLTVYRHLRVDGIFSGNGNTTFNGGGGGGRISGTSTISIDGYFSFYGPVSIQAGTTINKPGSFLINSGGALTNLGSTTLIASTLYLYTGGTYTNGVGGSLNVSLNFQMLGGSFDASAVTNTITFSSSTSTIPVPTTAYHHLIITGAATKTLLGNIQVNGNFTINPSANYAGGGFVMSLSGNWTNNVGAANTTNADVTFNGTSTQNILKGAAQENFRHVVVASTSTVLLVSSIQVLGNLTLTSGTLDVNTTNRTVYLSGSWSNTGGSFNPRSGTVRLQNSAAQSLTRVAGTETFFRLEKISGGVFTLNSSISVGQDLSISAGTLAVAGATSIFLTRNWVNTGGTFSPGTSTVLTLGAVAQSITKTASTETFHHFTKGTANTITLGSHISCTGNFFLGAGTLNCTATNYNITVGGHVTFNGTCSNNSNTFTLNGSAVQFMSGSVSQNFFNLTVNNTGAGISQTTGSHRVFSIFTPTLGNYGLVGAATMTFISTAAATAIIASGAGTFTGSAFTIQRFISARAANFHDFSSPVAASTLLDWDNEIYMSGVGGTDGNACCPIFYSVTTYDEPSASYTDVTTTGFALTPTLGLDIFLGDDLINWLGTSVLNSIGAPNTGGPSVVLSFSGASADPGANLRGNPHAAFMDWTTVLASSPGVDATFYMTDDGGNYVAYGAGDVIPPHQGFFCYATAGGQSLTFPQAAKTLSTASTFNRVARTHALTLKLNSTVTPYYHEIHVDLDENATMQYDNGLDARFVKSREPDAPNLTMVHNGDRLLIRNAFAPIEDIVVIPVRAKVGISGLYTISASGASDINDYTCVLLKDLTTGEVIDLKSVTTHTFQIHANDDPNRFVLYMIRNQADCDDVLARPAPPAYFNEYLVNVLNDGNSVFVNFDLDKLAPAVISVYDAVGQLVSETKTEISDGQVKLDMPETNGVYVVKILVNGQSFSRKVVLNN